MIRFTKITVRLFACIILSITPLMAKPIGVIKSISGRVFVFSNGQILEGRAGMTVDDFSNITTELGGQVTVADYNDRLLHLSGSGNMTFMKNLLELKSGYLWIQGKGSTVDTVLKTSNAQVVFNQVEGIISYDPSVEKTQVLTMAGHFDFSNIERSFFSERVQPECFHLSKSHMKMVLRESLLPLEKKSYLKIVSLFDGVEPASKNVILGGRVSSYKSVASKKTGRSLASTTSIDILSNQKVPDSALIERELGKLKKVKKVKRLPVSPVKINIFWPDHMNISSKSEPLAKIKRLPASLSPISPVIKDVEDKKFETDLIEEYKNQQKHSSELRNLIQELDSYKQNYNTNY